MCVALLAGVDLEQRPVRFGEPSARLAIPVTLDCDAWQRRLLRVGEQLAGHG